MVRRLQKVCFKKREHRAMVIFDGKKCGKLWKRSLIVYSLIQLKILLFKLKKEEKPSP